jgi:hypothetical protein
MPVTLHARPSDPQALKALAAAVAAAGSGGAVVPPPPEVKATSGPGLRLDLGEAGILEEPNAIARYLGECGDC